MRKFNLPALLASFLTHAGLYGWLISHPGPSQPYNAALHDRSRLTVTLLAQKSSNQSTAKLPAVMTQPVPSPITEQQEKKLDTTTLSDKDQNENRPTTAEQTEPGIVNLPLTFYPASALSRMPQPISKFEPQPPETGDTGIGGKLTIRLWIDASGNLDQVFVVSTDLPPAFEEAALAAFRKMRFSPGEINGAAVGALVEVVIEYADLLKQPGQKSLDNREEALPFPSPPSIGSDRPGSR